MKSLQLIFLIFFFLSCKKTTSYSQEIKNNKVYIIAFYNDTLKSKDISTLYSNEDYRLENFLIPITKEEYIKDSINYKNEYTFLYNILKTNNLIKIPCKNIKFEKKIKTRFR